MDWFLNYQDEKILILGDINYWTHYKYAMYYEERSNDLNNPASPHIFQAPTNKINLRTIYNGNISIANTISTGQYYLQSNEYSKQWKLTNPQAISENTYHTGYVVFDRVKQDMSINLIYANGEFESWLI